MNLRETVCHGNNHRYSPPFGAYVTGIEGIGFIIGLIGAIWMKSSINLLRERMEQPELKMEREQSLPPTKVSPLVRAPVIPVE